MESHSDVMPNESQYSLPTLVKNGRYWTISVDVDQSSYTTEYGVLGTKKPVRHTRKVVPKRKNTVAEQCWSEAKQEHREKLQAHYQPQHAERAHTVATVEATSSQNDAYDDVEERVPLPTTPVNATVLYNDSAPRLPMLAEKFHERMKVKGGIKLPIRMQAKANGVRGLFTLASTGVSIYSRTLHSYYFMTSLREAVAEVLKKRPTIVLDGEIYAHGLAGQNITSIVTQKTKPHPDEDRVCLHVFDCYDTTKPDLVYSERRAILEDLIPQRAGGRVELMHEETVNSFEELYAAHERNRGWEGSMLRFPDKPYYHKRSLFLIKLKFAREMDTIITDIQSTAGGDAVLVLRMEDGRTFPHRPEGTVEDKASWLADPSLVIGLTYSFSFTHLSEAGLPLSIHNGMIRFDLQ